MKPNPQKWEYDGSVLIETRKVNGTTVEIYGVFSEDTIEGEYNFYDLYVDGECINEGCPIYEYPDDERIDWWL